MKRFWFGAALLAVLLGLGIGAAWGAEKLNAPVARELEQAASEALSGSWEEAENLAGKAWSRWEKNWQLTAVAEDHRPLEAIDSLFAQLMVYTRSRDEVRFAACCAALCSQIRAVGDTHSLSWWNLL